MTVTDDLLDFVKEGLGRGMTRDEISAVLVSAGWHPNQVSDALRSFADVPSPIPVPRPRPYLSAREAFTYLVLFVTLYLSAFSFGSLVFDLIDANITDAASRRSPAQIMESVRWWISMLIVVFPVFLFMAWRTARELREDPAKRSSRIRRQLSYATMFIAACVLIGDLTTLVYFALGGELTLRFILKVLTVAAVGGAAFAYCRSDIDGDEPEGHS